MKPFFLPVLALFVLLLPSFVLAQPAAPTELHGAYYGGKVYLGWQYSWFDHITAFHIYRTDNGGSTFSVIGRTPWQFYADTTVVPNGEYHYFVTAVQDSGSDSTESSPSDTIDVMTVFHPAPPQDLFGYADSAGAHLGWQRPENHDSILYYNVYRWSVNDTVPAKIGSPVVTNFTDGAFNPAVRTFYAVTAVYQQNSAESVPSNIISLPHAQSAIFFTSLPVKSALVGKLYSYQATVVTNPAGQKVCFSLDDAPDGMTIDSTGLVTWTPASGGMFEVSIKAHLCDSGDGEAEQEYALFVLNGAAGSVSGIVQDPHGAGVPRVKIKLFDVHWGDFVLRTFTDSTGHYSFPIVNPSTYLLRAVPDTGSGLAPQWYNGAADIHDATPIAVAESADVVINITLTAALPPPPLFTLSGYVLDDSSHPVPGAHVEATLAFHDSSYGMHMDGEGEWNDEVDTRADSGGHYSLILRGGKYIVGAHKFGFYPQFFDHKASPLDADVITLASDTTGISFNLHPFMHGSGVIAGTIFSRSDSSRLKAYVAGFHRPAPDSAFDGMVVYARTDSAGRYALTGLVDGYYIVLAVSHDDYIPTFYSTSGGTPFHDSATAVQIVSNDSVGGIDIYAFPDSSDGLNSIAGHVETTEGFNAPNVSPSPASGVIVIASDGTTNAPRGTAITGMDGSYAITGLAPGTYNVTFQKPGSATTTSRVSLSYVNNSPTVTTVNAQMSAGGNAGGLGAMSVTRHWNLVSLPVTVSDQQVTSVFPSAISEAFRFDAGSGYSASPTLDYSSGYWLRFDVDEAFTIAGTSRASQTIPISAGWNLIGSISNPVSTASIAASPSGILQSEFFGYSNGYSVATEIQPGHGYWVLSSASGSLTLTSSGAAKTGAGSPASLEGLNSLTFRNNDGESQTLFFGAESPQLSPDRYKMPPLPPQSGFDVRFASQRMLETVNPRTAHSVDYPIAVQTSAQSITIGWSMQSSTYRALLVDDKGKTIAQLSGNGSVTVPATTKLALRVESGQIPAQYALFQNYPNPFNPSTRISFAIPEPAIVTLRVYNLLGQVVAELVRGQRYDAGSYEIPFDGSSLSSGVYLYRLQAGRFSDVRKMVLLK